MNRDPITLRYRKWAWPVREEGVFFSKLFEEITGRPIHVIEGNIPRISNLLVAGKLKYFLRGKMKGRLRVDGMPT